MAMRYFAPIPGGGGDAPRPPGGPGGPGGPHALRVGDAERDAAAADLGEHYTAGRLTLDELNERLDAVFSSKTFGQLTQIMVDLPGPGRLPWRTAHVRTDGSGAPAGFPDDGPFWMTDGPWHAANSSMIGFQTRGPQAPPTPSDRAGRVAALSLLLLAMLIWLFTALLFARHGFYHPVGPSGPFNHYVQYGSQGMNQP